MNQTRDQVWTISEVTKKWRQSTVGWSVDESSKMAKTRDHFGVAVVDVVGAGGEVLGRWSVLDVAVEVN